MARNIDWNFNKDIGTLNLKTNKDEYKNLEKFIFKLHRYKSNENFKEWLNIQCYLTDENGIQNENGNIVTTISTLENDLKKFWDYGVVLNKTLFYDLTQQVINNYLDLKIEKPPLLTDQNNINEVINVIKDCLFEFAYKDGYYHIPVEIFNSFFEEGQLSKYNVQTVKRCLLESGYTKANYGRLSNLVRLKGNSSPTRVISISADKLGINTKENSKEL